MPPRNMLTGQKFGRLTVLAWDEARTKATGRTHWRCECECGGSTSAAAGNLRSGNSKSCGCEKRTASSRTRFRDISGRRFGRLTVVALAHRRVEPHWECLCDCGGGVEVRGASLKNGHTRSCGCLRDEVTARNFDPVRHGMSQTPTWQSWSNMRGRCLNPNHHAYDRYGGRGITICPEWDSFEQFHADMGPRLEGMTLDRIDPDGNYEPGNCRWADWSTQRRNQRRNKEKT